MRGLSTKSNEFLSNVKLNSFDTIVLTETWLNESHYDSELFDSRYQVFRKDRDIILSGKKRGGGVLIAVNNFYTSNRQYHMEYCSPFVEMLTVKIDVSNRFSFYLCGVYIRPNCSLAIYEELFDFISNIAEFVSNELMIIGDFNIPEINGTSFDFNHSTKTACSLYNLMNYLDLNSYNNCLNNRNRTLDLVLSNLDQPLSIKTENGLVPEDFNHPPLLCNFSFNAQNISDNPSIGINDHYNFEKTDLFALKTTLAKEDWSEIEMTSDIDNAVEIFYSKLHNSFLKHVPIKRNIKNFQNRYPKHFTKELITSLRHKDYYRKIKKDNIKYEENYKKFRNLSKKILKSIETRNINNIKDNIKSDPNYLWKYISSKKSSLTCDKFKDTNGHSLNNQEVANKFAENFQSIFRKGRQFQGFQNFNLPQQSIFSFSSISVDNVISTLRFMKNKKSSGPDRIPIKILKVCANELAKPLSILFNNSITTSVYPSKFKDSYVVPIYKKGDSSNTKNYRGITILTNLSKIFESILYNQMYPFFSTKFSCKQHGFVRQRSTLTNLLNYTHIITEAFDSHCQVDSIYIDFEKAFDKIAFSLILKCLNLFGASSSVIDFFQSYFCDRTQFVKYKNCFSFPYNVLSGSSQGSIFGPFFFNLIINSLPTVVKHSHILLFADDAKIFRKIKTLDDAKLLQKDMDAIIKWVDENDLSLNLDKCEIMSFSKKNNIILHKYFLSDHEVRRVTEVKDLGITLDQKLTFKTHIQNISAKSHRMLGFTMRMSKEFKNNDISKLLFNAFVRSILEYNSVLWSSQPKYIINQLEKIQAKFCRLLFFYNNGFYPTWPHAVSYKSLLETLEMHTLKDRRLAYNIVFANKLLNNLVDDVFLRSNFILRSHNNYTLRKFSVFYVSNHIPKYSPLLNIINSVNNFSAPDCFSLSKFLKDY